MNWFVAYLISVILVPALFAMFMCDSGDNKVVIVGGEMVFPLLFFCLLWFIFVPYILVGSAVDNYKHYYKNKAEEIFRKHNIEYMRNGDKSHITVVPEGDLKFLLRAYRKKRIDLKAVQVELIRDELLSRNMERNLLK